MKATELLEIKLKKYSVKQLIEKLEKGSKDEEKSIIISILEKRGQDVSKYKTLVEEIQETYDSSEEIVEKIVEPTKGELKEKVDEFVDKLIERHDNANYSKVMSILGGEFDSDLDDLFETATVDQLKEALKLDILTEGGETPKKPAENKSKPINKSDKISKSSVLKEIEEETQKFKDGEEVEFLNKGVYQKGVVKKFTFDKTDRCYYYVLIAGSKVTYKRPKNVRGL